LLESLRNLTLAKLPESNGAQSPLADLPDQEAAELRRIAAAPSSRDLMRLFHLMAASQEQIIRSPYPDLLLEMAVIRMASLAPVIDADELLKAIGKARTMAAPNGGGPAPSSSQMPSSAGPASVPPASSLRGAAASLLAPADVQMVAAVSPEPAGAAAAMGANLSPAPSRRIPVDGEVKADAPRKAPGGPGDLPELREFIRNRRAALAGFMEQGAILQLADDVITVTPRNDIYIRYLSDNRNVIAGLASEMYARKICVEMAAIAAPSAAPAAAIPLGEAASARTTGGMNGTALPPTAPAEAAPRPETALTASPASAKEANGAEWVAKPRGSFATAFAKAAGDVATVATDSAKPAVAQADLKQAVYADPVVQRLFNEFQARLVEVRAGTEDTTSGKR
jgi:hypothetical protein